MDQFDLDVKKSDVFLAMVMCSFFLRDVPMGFREKVLLFLLVTKYVDMYIKTESDIQWADKQIKRMERELKRDEQDRGLEQVNRLEQDRGIEQVNRLEQLAPRGTDSNVWDRSSDDEVFENVEL